LWGQFINLPQKNILSILQKKMSLDVVLVASTYEQGANTQVRPYKNL